MNPWGCGIGGGDARPGRDESLTFPYPRHNSSVHQVTVVMIVNVASEILA
jgi:hypothetical protein